MPKKLVSNLTIAVFGALAALLVVELLFRGATLLGKAQKKWSDRPEFYFMPEKARSLQDRQYEREKPANVYRIAVMGDSFTFGPNMQFDDVYTERLERWLNLGPGRPVEVINFGVSGFSTHHQVQLLEKVMLFDPDLVLLEITLNDPELKPLSEEERDKIFGGAYLKSPIFSFWQSGRYFFSRLHNTATHRKYIHYFNNLFENPELFGNFTQAIEKLNKACKEKGIRFVAVVFPLFTFPLNDSYPFATLHAKIQHTLHSLQIPNLDLLDAYLQIPFERLQVIPSVDTHPNEIAHRIAAEKILAWLARHEFVPAQALPVNVYRKRRDLKSKRFTKDWTKERKRN